MIGNTSVGFIDESWRQQLKILLVRKELDGVEVDFFKVPCEFSPSAALWRGAFMTGSWFWCTWCGRHSLTLFHWSTGGNMLTNTATNQQQKTRTVKHWCRQLNIKVTGWRKSTFVGPRGSTRWVLMINTECKNKKLHRVPLNRHTWCNLKSTEMKNGYINCRIFHFIATALVTAVVHMIISPIPDSVVSNGSQKIQHLNEHILKTSRLWVWTCCQSNKKVLHTCSSVGLQSV